MLTSEERWTTSAHAFETTVVSTGAAVSALSQHVAGLLPYSGSALDPRFFVATVDERVWIPRVVVVTRSGSIAGVVYFKERKFSGLPTGILYGDDTLHTMRSPGPRPSADRRVAAAAVRSRSSPAVIQRLAEPGFDASRRSGAAGRFDQVRAHARGSVPPAVNVSASTREPAGRWSRQGLGCTARDGSAPLQPDCAGGTRPRTATATTSTRAARGRPSAGGVRSIVGGRPVRGTALPRRAKAG